MNAFVYNHTVPGTLDHCHVIPQEISHVGTTDAMGKFPPNGKIV